MDDVVLQRLESQICNLHDERGLFPNLKTLISSVYVWNTIHHDVFQLSKRPLHWTQSALTRTAL